MQQQTQDYYLPLEHMDIYVYERRKIVHVELKFSIIGIMKLEHPFGVMMKKEHFTIGLIN